MALESFGTLVAKQINQATILCHDMLLDDGDPDRVATKFKAGDPPIWSVRPGKWPSGEPCVIILLGVG